LIEGRSGGHLWADRFDRDLDDIFAIQDEISKAIVRALKIKLLPEEKKAIEQRGTQSAEAYNLYLLARQYWVTGNHGDPRREERVMRICSRTVEIDPYYADAWALLALAQCNLRYQYDRQVDDGFAAAHAALAIDPTIAEAHLPMFKRLQERRQFDAAAAEMETAIRLGPESWSVNKEAGVTWARQRGTTKKPSRSWIRTSTRGPCSRLATKRRAKVRSGARPRRKWYPKRSEQFSRIRVTERRSASWPADTPSWVRGKKPGSGSIERC
jgi:tetratricopeptide (TPR) repeat protein